MRRILFRHICKNRIHQTVGLIFLIGIYLVVVGLSYYDNISGIQGTFWEIYPDMIGAYGGVFAFLIMGEVSSGILPDAVFLMPVSRKERERITAGLWLSSWLGMSMVFSIIMYLPIILEDGIHFLYSILILLSVLALVYICQYSEYFRAIRNGLGSVLILCNVVVMAMMLFLLLSSGEWIAEGKTVDIVMFAVILFFSGMNMHIHKKYFKKMIRYYADYESVRQLKKKKKSKRLLRGMES